MLKALTELFERTLGGSAPAAADASAARRHAVRVATALLLIEVARADFSEDPRWIANQVRPRISPTEAAESMKLLLSLGLLVRDPDTGRVLRGEPTLTTEHEVRSLGAAAFHRQMIERAAESIETVPRELRDLAALTVCISPKTAALVKERIHQFRESLTELCDSDAAGEVVYQLNVQWFPLSSARGENLE